ncbi:MAG: hypothetical protein HQL29_00825 [Candidatus Omnitrophica bacterium]|nr:hypothetical protein [Candidatus Omnitrophota bacterium]
MSNEKNKTVSVIKNTASEIKRSFRERSEEVADLIVNEKGISKEERNKLLKKETLDTFKDLFGSVKKNFGQLTFKSLTKDLSFGLGKVTGSVKASCKSVIKELF